MAIKQRKQLTGTTAQINAYAGVEGQLVWDNTKKKWVGMSGTAGTNYPMASESHTHSITNVTGLQDALNGKLATTAQIPYSQLTGTPSIPDVSGLIPKTGYRGTLAGYETWTKVGATTTLDISSGDALLLDTGGEAATINVQVGGVGQVATKLVWVALSKKYVTINGTVGWFAGAIPALTKGNAVFVFFFHDTFVDCRLLGQWS